MPHPMFREDIVEAFYAAVFSARRSRSSTALDSLHIPVSDVFYARAAIEAATGVRYPLSQIEEAMFREGMLAAEDCFENAKHYA